MSQVTRTKQVPVSKTFAGANDRTVFSAEEIATLAQSITEHGLIQPITVRPKGDGFEIIAGERRFRAISSLGWDTFPGIVKDVSDEEASAMMLAENTARKDIDPIDEATAYKKRMDEFGWTIEQVAQKAGVSGSRVRQRCKLLLLEDTVQKLTRSGQLPLGYAQCLIDAGLTFSQQISAMRIFSGKEAPTLDWFRTIVSELAALQQQNMLDEFELELQIQNAPKDNGDAPNPKTLPRPLTSSAPLIGDNPVELLTNQAAYWRKAEGAWMSLNSKWFAYECQIAAQALEAALAGMVK